MCRRKLLPVRCRHLGPDRWPQASHGTVNIVEIDQQTTKIWRDGKSGEVGPVVFDHLQTWWVIASGGVFERLPVGGRWFFEVLVLLEVRLDDICGIPAWRHQTGSSFPERCLMCLAIGPPSGDRHRSRKHVGDTGNRSGILLPVRCHHGGIRPKSTGPA